MSAKKSNQLQVRLEPETEKKFREYAEANGAGAAEYARKLIHLALEWADRKGSLPSPPAVTTSTHLKSLEQELDTLYRSGASAPQLNEVAATDDQRVAAAIRLLQSLPAGASPASPGTRK